jgi:hypothetical protein
MQRHGPSCLSGPLSGRTGKAFPAASEDGKGESISAPKPSLTSAERQARIDRIRREIAEGVYDTPEKFAMALDQLFRRLEQE